MDIKRPPVETSPIPITPPEVVTTPETSGNGGDGLSPLMGGVVELDATSVDGANPDMTRPGDSPADHHPPVTEWHDHPAGVADGAPSGEVPAAAGGQEGARGEAPGDVPAETPPEVREGYSRITIIKEVGEGIERKVEARPVQQHVTDRVLAGETVRTEFTRIEIGGDVNFTADDSSVPRYATRVPVPKDPPAEHAKFTAWVALDCIKHTPKGSDEGGGQQSGGRIDEPEAMDLPGFLARSNAPFRMVMEGRPVHPAEVAKLRKFASRAYTDTKETEGKASQAAEYGSFRDEIDEASEHGLVDRRVVVGFQTDDPLEADRLARQFASAVFKGENVTWTPRNGPAGRAETYRSEQEALDATDPPARMNARGQVEPNMNRYVTGERYARAVMYPVTNVPGLEIRRQVMLAADRTVPQGVDSVRVGRIVDNEGQRGKPLEVTEAHSLTVAETGAGKTNLMHNKIVEMSVKNYEQGRKCAEIIIDCEKVGNNLRISELLSGRGLPESHATVNHIDLGSDDVRININPLRPCGDLSPSDQLSISANILGSTLTEDARRVFVKFYKMAGEDILESQGIDPVTGKSRLPHGRFIDPDPEMVANSMEKVINSSSFQDATKGDIGGFSLSQWKDFMRGAAAKMFLGGHSLDIEAMVRHSYETGEKMSIDLGNIRDPQSKEIAGTLLMEGINAACRKMKLEMGITGDIKQRLAHVSLDEAQAVYRADSPLAEKLAASHKIARGAAGMVIDTYVQSPSGLHDHIVKNSPNTLALRVTDGSDRETLAGRLAGIPKEDLNDLITAVPGTGLHYGQYMGDKPVRFEIPDMDTAERGPSYINSRPSHVVDMECYKEMYTADVKIEARSWLQETEEGQRLRAWVDMNTTWLAYGERLSKLTDIPDIPLDVELPDNYDPNLKEILAGMGGVDVKIRDCAVSLAVRSSVLGRKDLQWQGDPVDDVMKPLVDYSLPQVQGMDAPVFPDEVRVKLALDVGRYGPVKAELNSVGVLTAPRLRDSQRYERVLGGVGGMTADEQSDNVVKLEKEAVERIGKVVINQTIQNTINSTQGGLFNEDAIDDPTVDANKAAVKQAINNVTADYHRLVGRGGDEAKLHLWNRISQEKKQPLTEGDIRVLSEIMERAEAVGPPLPREEMVSYRDMHAEIKRQQEAAKGSPAIDLSKWEAIYSDLFDREVKFGGTTAAEQLRAVERAERLLLARSRQRGRVREDDLVLAPDVMGGKASTLENVVQYFMGSQDPRGDVHDRLNSLYRLRTDRSLPALISSQADKARKGKQDPQMKSWVETFATEVAYSRHFDADPAAIRSLVMKIFKLRQGMEKKAAASAA